MRYLRLNRSPEAAGVADAMVEAKFSYREGDEARCVGLEAMPLDQHIKRGAIGVIRNHSLKIAFNIKRLSVSRRDENRF
jgi:hypothetical protein